MTATVTDLFCGAGGSSWGAREAGMELQVAANHWQTAIEVHQTHFPDARHDVADISQADPRRYPATDILLASPECTNHSQSRGVSRRRQDPSLWDAPDPSAERSRATMWCVGRFAEQIDYAAIVVENVVDVVRWSGWRPWLSWLHNLGYQHTLVSANSMHHGVPQSRDRLYVVFTKKGLAVDLAHTLTAYCAGCDRTTVCRQVWKPGRAVGRYRQQWLWACTVCDTPCEPATRPAADIIDWALPTPRIGDRARPLATKTRERILAGLQRHGWAPIITAGAGHGHERTPGNRARPLTEPLPVQSGTATHAVATPPGFLVQPAHGGRTHNLDDPHPTVCASDDRHGLVVPLRANGHARATPEVLPTVAAAGNHHGLLMRNNTARGDQGQMVTPVTEPARTMTTTGHQSLIVPYYGRADAQPIDRPLPTVRTRHAAALLEPDQLVDNCGFRMLEPAEIAAAMAFPDGYIPGDLPKKTRVRLAGNAVTPPVMTWICSRVLHALETTA